MLKRGLLALLVQFEDHIIQAILRRPGFHRFVGRIHRTIDEKKNGRSPVEPMRPGEATEEPGKEGFASHFWRELSNQAKGKPSRDGGAGDKGVTRR